jgi:hypothetical protein
MKKNIIALTITAAVLAIAASQGLRAEDQKPTSTENGGGCQGGGCHKGHKTPEPTPAPSPAK